MQVCSLSGVILLHQYSTEAGLVLEHYFVQVDGLVVACLGSDVAILEGVRRVVVVLVEVVEGFEPVVVLRHNLRLIQNFQGQLLVDAFLKTELFSPCLIGFQRRERPIRQLLNKPGFRRILNLLLQVRDIGLKACAFLVGARREHTVVVAVCLDLFLAVLLLYRAFLLVSEVLRYSASLSGLGCQGSRPSLLDFLTKEWLLTLSRTVIAL